MHHDGNRDVMAYKFPIPRSDKADLKIPTLKDVEDEREEEEPGIINEQQARSLLEWRVAKALWSMQYEFMYQFEVFGGTNVRGGYVIDFLVFAAPNSIPLEVQGDRWHTNQFASGELMRQALIESYLGTELRYVWENELGSQEEANIAVRNALQ